MIPKVTVPEGQRGPWKITRFTIDEKTANDSLMRSVFGRGRGALVTGEYTRLTCNGAVIMSDTPHEMRDHEPIVRRARGHVLINGLGLGMVLGAVMRKPDVETVTVVELDPDVIALVAPHYTAPNVTVVEGDALTWKPPRGARYEAVWHDIWSSICTDNLDSMTTLKRRYGRRSNWQGCWAEYYTKRLVKRGW